MKTTSAFVLIDTDYNILGCHATGKPDNCGYDFPKGLVDAGETDKQAAIRELKEETGLDFSVMSYMRLLDLGTHKHNREKNIHLFLCIVDVLPDISALHCDSFFELNGKQIPEVNKYMHAPKEKRNMFNKVLQDKFVIIDKALEQFKNELKIK